jgi:hypothetical protein
MMTGLCAQKQDEVSGHPSCLDRFTLVDRDFEPEAVDHIDACKA